MKILHVIDSLEINGGSMMCFEMATAMKNHFTDCQIECLVVSKTGKFGRKNILADNIAADYGWNIKSINYDFNSFTASITLENAREYTRTVSLPARGS